MRPFIPLLLVLAVASPFEAQAQADSGPIYDRTDAMIPMRDGVRLYTVLYTPRGLAGPLPILFRRTPYGVDHTPSPTAMDYFKALARDGYVFAFQDIRGRFKSEGQFVMQRTPRDRRDANAIDEGSDAYDTMDWLVKNIPANNGRVGMLGVSYDGWLTVMALTDPHPAFRAASPQASPADMFLGDDFHHQGAFRLSYGFEYAALLESSDTANTQFTFDQYDTYEWYLRLGPLANANTRYFHGTLPTWNDFVAHPNYDEFWKRQRITPYLGADVTVPTLSVAGWWDQEDFYGPLGIYREMERHDPQQRNYLVVGPWNHGGWGGGEGRHWAASISTALRRPVPRAHPGPVLRVLLEGPGRARPNRRPCCARAAPITGAASTVAAARGDGAQSLFPRRRKTVLRSAARLRIGVRSVRLRSRASRAVSESAHRADLLPARLGLVHVAIAGSAISCRVVPTC